MKILCIPLHYICVWNYIAAFNRYSSYSPVDGQAGLACCSPWGTELNILFPNHLSIYTNIYFYTYTLYNSENQLTFKGLEMGDINKLQKSHTMEYYAIIENVTVF